MRMTVVLDEKDLRDVIRYTGERKKSSAVRKFIANSLLLKRRQELTEKVMSGEGQFELPDWDKIRSKDREDSWRR